MVTREQVSEIARIQFLAGRPRLKSEISALTEDQACGSTLDEFRTIYFQNELAKEAKRQGVTSWGYQLRLAEDRGLDVTALREEDRRAEADALGIEILL